MKNLILEVLREHPTGLRLREIAMYLRCSPYALINELDQLKKAGKVDGTGVNNFVQGESYILWHAV
jgi:DNA-binding Lrp family transcriptional regulator